MKKTLSCGHFVDAGFWEWSKCCASCHYESSEHDIELCYYAPDGSHKVHAEVCCSFQPPFKDEKSRHIFAKALWHRRKNRT